MRDMPTFDEQIAQSIRTSEQSGELQAARDWGKPLDFGDGYDETPEHLRMGYKILKDAGFAPPEVEMMKELQARRDRLAALDPSGDEARQLREDIARLALTVQLRIEALAREGRSA